MSIPQQDAPAYSGAEEYAYHEEPDSRAAQSFERVPPQDLNAEQSVLGGMLLSKDAIGDVIEVLKARDFYRPAHETIFQAIVGLYAKGEPADPITVAAELGKRSELTRVGGPPYLHTLVEAVPTAANAEHYAEIVREQAVFRRLTEAGTRIVQMGYAAEGEASEIADAAQAELFSVIGDRSESDAVPLSKSIVSMADRLEQRKRQGGGLRGLSTGFADLDALTSGLTGGQFVIVAGRPAMGKSTVALDFARQCAVVDKLPCAVFSLEMRREEIEDRVVSAHARIAHNHMKSGEMTDDDWTRFARYYPDFEDAPLFIDDSEHLTAMDIAAKARRLKQQHDIRLVVIDYIQLMQSGGRKAETRQQEVSDISRSLKLLATQLDVPVIGLSQLNRGPESRVDKKPLASDLRESGSLEQDADIVILLHREDAYDKESPRAGEADLIVAKHRGGPTSTITVAFQGHYSRFVDMART